MVAGDNLFSFSLSQSKNLPAIDDQHVGENEKRLIDTAVFKRRRGMN